MVRWVRMLSMGSPLFLFRHALMPSSLWFSSMLVKFCAGAVRELGHHNISGVGPSRVELHISVESIDISLPSSLKACSARSILRFVCFCAFSQSNTVLNIVSSLCALAHLLTCISTSGQPAVTHTSCSKH